MHNIPNKSRFFPKNPGFSLPKPYIIYAFITTFQKSFKRKSANRKICKNLPQKNQNAVLWHNDRNFDLNPEHIAKDKSDKNVIWSWCGTDISFDKGELKYYKETFGAQLEQTNQNYIKSRHKERVVTMDEWRKKAMHAPEEQILQIGRMEQYPEVEVSLSSLRNI